MSQKYVDYIDGIKSGDFGSSPNVIIVDENGYGDYTSIISAYSDISGNASDNRFIIYVVGKITENSVISAKSYVDVVGVGEAEIVVDMPDTDFGIRFSNVSDINFKDIIITREGTTTSTAGTVGFSGTVNGVTFDNVKFYLNTSGVASGNYNIYSVGCTCNTKGNTFKNCKFYTSCTGNKTTSIYLKGITSTISEKTLFERCEIYGSSGGGSDNTALTIGNTVVTCRDCIIQGGTGTNSHSNNNTINIMYGGVLYLDSCTVRQHAVNTSCSNIYVYNNGVVNAKNCRIYTPQYSTTGTTYTLYARDSSTVILDSCDIVCPTGDRNNYVYTGAGTQAFRPTDGENNPYYIDNMVVWVTTPVVGSTLDIGTTDGGSDISSGVSLATGGIIAIQINKIARDIGEYVYAVPSDTSARFSIYYNFVYNVGSQHIKCMEYATLYLTNCKIITSHATSSYPIHLGDNTGIVKISNCRIEASTLTSAAIASNVDVYDLDVTNSYLYGVLDTRLKSFVSHANNSGPGWISLENARKDLGEVIDSLGTPVLLCNFVQYPIGTSVTDYTRYSNNLTSIDNLNSGVLGFIGESRYYDFNGTAHYLYRANDTDFDFGNAATDDAFSIVCCVNPDDVTSRQIIGKWDDNNQREWRLFFDASGYPTIQLYDESADTYIGRQDQTAFTTGSWQVLVATYDGSGINAGCKIYIDGVQLDDTDYDNGAYVAMEAVTANLMVGALKNAAAYSEYFDGKMTWLGVAAKELSADEVWSLTQRLKGVLGI